MIGDTAGGSPLLPNGCTIERARHLLALYDIRSRAGYQNQRIAARDILRHATGMGVRELRAWLRQNGGTDATV